MIDTRMSKRVFSPGRRAIGLAVFALALASPGPLAELAPVANAQSDDEQDALLVDEARRAIAKRQYSKAAGLLDRALRINPRRVDAYVLRATVHGQNKEYDKGIRLMRQARELAPNNPFVLTTLGRQLLLAKRPDEAVPILERVVSGWPDRYEAHVLLGSHYVDRGQWQEAITAYESYLRTRPKSLADTDSTHRLDLANAYLRSGNPQKANAIYTQIVSDDADSVLGQLGLAWSTAAIDCRQAMPMLRDMQALAEKYPEVLVVRARCALLLGDQVQALAQAEAYRDQRKDSPDAWALVAEAHVAGRDYAAAMTAMTEASKLDQENRRYVLELARIERLAGKPEQGIARLRATEAPAGAEDDWTIELGECLAAARKYDEVKQMFAPFVQENADSAKGHMLLGIATYELGDAEGAIPSLEQSLKIDASETRARPPLIGALNVVAVEAFGASDLEKAEVYLVRAEAVGDSAMTWRNLGAVRLVAGKAQAAVAPLKNAAGLAPDDPVIHHLLGRAYHGTGDPQGALKLYARAATLTPNANRALKTKIALDQAASMVAIGDGDTALSLLEGALGTAASAAQRARVADAYVTAGRKLATDSMNNSNFLAARNTLGRVTNKLPPNTSTKAMNALNCDLALAATGAGRAKAALKLLRKMEKNKVRCPFVAPADALAVQILIAWNEGATARNARKALRRLGAMRRRATGPAEPLVRTAARDIAIRAAIDAYKRKNVRKARQFLDTARKYDPRSRDIDHNLAVLDLAGGKIDRAIRQLRSTVGSVPEALINLGIAHERKSNQKKALEYFRRAVDAGVRATEVRRWIERKERLWGKSQGGEI